MSRDRDVRNAIQAALINTGAFDSVWIWGLPEDYGASSSNLAAAAIEPASSEQTDRWDDAVAGGLLVKSSVTITLLYRHEDPQLRDEAVELLFTTAADALNGKSLAALTVPAFTRFASWSWQKPTPPERRIVASFSYQYIVDGWDSYDVTA
jgi:hypothetical protein